MLTTTLLKYIVRNAMIETILLKKIWWAVSKTMYKHTLKIATILLNCICQATKEKFLYTAAPTPLAVVKSTGWLSGKKQWNTAPSWYPRSLADSEKDLAELFRSINMISQNGHILSLTSLKIKDKSELCLFLNQDARLNISDPTLHKPLKKQKHPVH